jgi:predicted 3-demethylubiquinone-9 3-methyltransferase (glyoxalase superfamily)
VAINAGPEFKFTEAISFDIRCKDQAEIDFYWEKLSAVPESEQCGWCKDKYGLSWQIVPEGMEELMKQPGAFAKLMAMHKIVIADF